MEMEIEAEQAWATALDVDDSDIPSLIRPCKRRRFPSIPGPAGPVQSAMLRKSLDRQNPNNNDGLVSSTQDYIRKAVMDDDTAAEFDDDFTRPPWLSAQQFIGVMPTTPISSIKKCAVTGSRVDQVVAVVKSCTPNGLGGLIVMLKDPTGTVGASVHHKVLCEGEFGKNLTVGAVLIIRKVAIFAPVRSSQYLNITLKNLVKVFCQDSRPPQKQEKSAHPDIEEGEKDQTFEDISIVQNIETEETTVGGRQNTGKQEHMQNYSVIQKHNLVAGSSGYNGRASSGITAALRRGGHPETGQGVCNEDTVRSKHTGDQLEHSQKTSEAGSLESGFISNTTPLVAASSATKSSFEEIVITNEAQMKQPPMIVKPSLPQWTDEQLDELFAVDEDDGSLS